MCSLSRTNTSLNNSQIVSTESLVIDGVTSSTTMHVFVTVGTTKFDSLIYKALSLEFLKILSKLHCKVLVIQHGDSILTLGSHLNKQSNTEYNFNDISIEIFSFKPSISQDILNSDIVISHAGSGSILESLESGKRLLVCVNETLMDNHQYELAIKLHQEGFLMHCVPENLINTFQEFQNTKFVRFSCGNGVKFVELMNKMFIA